MSGSLYLREWSAAVKRRNAKSPDLIEQLEASDRRKQLTIFGIRRTLRKLGAGIAVDLERLNAHELDQVRLDIATRFRRKQREESAPLPAPTKQESNTPQNR
jgi:hypothetical protein